MSLPRPASMSPLLLWSAGSLVRYKVNQRYFGHHFVWCSPAFEAAALSRNSIGSQIAASSDPATLYRRLHADVTSRDRHSNEIIRQKQSIKAAALRHMANNHISAERAAEVATFVDVADSSDWRPVIYVIPFDRVASRVQVVPINDCASLEPEFIVPDLVDGEFEVIEPWPC